MLSESPLCYNPFHKTPRLIFALLRLWISYDIALLYLKQVDYDVDAAVEAYLSDEKWEKEHPMEANVKGKRKDDRPRRCRFGLSNGITGQLS